MEALIRWFHKDAGFISPGEFIPIAEETGIIVPLSYWIFREAMKQVKYWNETYDKSYIVGINLSPVSLDHIDFFSRLNQIIANVGVEPSQLEFEITEHSAMNSSATMEEVFITLSGLGSSISIDDFGTGYSSLSYIKRFSVGRLKIAKELIDCIEEDGDDLLIVKAIIMMCQGMGLKTIAEGVENEGQLERLKQLGCDFIQGYILGRPASVENFEKAYF